MNRRKFVKGAGALGLATLVAEPHGFLNRAFAALPNGEALQRLSYRAHRSVDFEGSWVASRIEGRIPDSISGILYRNGSGQKDVFGTSLAHFFDGDAYVSAIHLHDGKVSGFSKFINTPERQAETTAKRMRYHDFGTRCPTRAEGFKNPPSINIAHINGMTLALSEGAHPVKIDPETLAAEGAQSFSGSLAEDVTFTAHPRQDPETGDWYAYGITKGMSPALKVYRLPNGQSQFTVIGSISLGGFYPVHDFVMTKSYLVFVLPPVYISLWGMIRGDSCVAENLVYENKPLRIFVLRKDGRDSVRSFTSGPASMIFHHANAVESADGKTIKFWSLEIEDASVFELLGRWADKSLPAGPRSWLTEFTLSLDQKTVKRERLTDGTPSDFPAVNPLKRGLEPAEVFSISVGPSAGDALAFNALTRFEVDTRKTQRAFAGTGQMFGEPVYVNGRSSDWLLHLGYDDSRDESFLDIRRPQNLDLVARAWLSRRIPLGFHGQYFGEG